MKGKQLSLLLVVLAVLGLAGWFTLSSSRSSWSENSAATAGAKVLAFPVNDVARIGLKTSAGELNLVRQKDVWTVQERGDYPANFEMISGLLRKLNDLKTVQEVKAGASQHARFDLLAPDKGAGSGTLLELKDQGGKTLAALVLGKKFMRKSEGSGPDGPGFPAGRYVLPVGAKVGSVSLVSDAFDDAEIKPERWIAKDFFKVENPRAITLAGTTPVRAWKVTKETTSTDWALADLKGEEKADPSKIAAFASSLANASFSDVLAADTKTEVSGLDQPTLLMVETFDGLSYVLKIGKAYGDGYAATLAVSGTIAKERVLGKDEKPEDKEKLDKEFAEKTKRLTEKLAAEQKIPARIFVLPKFVLDPFLKDRSALLVDKPVTPPAASPVPAPGAAAPVPAAPVAPTTSVVTPAVAVPPAPVPSKPAKK